MKRPAITAKMKLMCVMSRASVRCALCGLNIDAEDAIEWDHVWELSDGGPNDFTNLRPLHEACHQRKTAIACKQRARVARLVKGKKPSKHPMKSRKAVWPKRKIGASR